MKSRPPLFVLQMGKVGSTSLAEALMRTRKYDVFQIHLLNQDAIHQAMQAHEDRRFYPPRHFLVSKFVLRHILPCCGRPKIITLVRDPVARNISAYFQNLDLHNPYRSSEQPDTSALIDDFFKTNFHNFPIEYFDREIKSQFDVDVYRYRFPYEDGYQIIATPEAEILIMQFETDEQKKKAAICNFLDIPSIMIPKLNRSEDKYYREQYKKVLNEIVIPESYLDQMYESIYMKHFYGPQQILAFTKRWLRS